MATQKKIDLVTELSDKASQAKSIIFADYKGITHKQLEELRKELKTLNAEMIVAKNRLLLRALGDKAESVKDILNQETAAIFNFGDEVSGVKAFTKFIKTVNMGKAKGGLLGDTVLNAKDVIKLAEIPSKEVLVSKLLGQLQAPLYGLHYALSWNMNKLVWALNSIKEKKY